MRTLCLVLLAVSAVVLAGCKQNPAPNVFHEVTVAEADDERETPGKFLVLKESFIDGAWIVTGGNQSPVFEVDTETRQIRICDERDKNCDNFILESAIPGTGYIDAILSAIIGTEDSPMKYRVRFVYKNSNTIQMRHLEGGRESFTLQRVEAY